MDRDRCVHELFAAQAARTPEAIALVYEDEQLSYGELERRSNQLAHHLRGLGVGPEVVVGLCVERSAAMVIGLLGILKAGGAYLPLDPSYPSERLAYMLGDAKALLLLTQTQLAERLPSHQALLVRLDADWASIAASPTTVPRGADHPRQPRLYNLYLGFDRPAEGRCHLSLRHRPAWSRAPDTSCWSKTTYSFICRAIGVRCLDV